VKKFCIFFILIFFSGCTTGVYVIPLKEVEISGQPASKNTIYLYKLDSIAAEPDAKKYRIINADKNKENQYVYGYEDEVINTNWIVGNNAIYLSLENRTNADLKIIWNEARYTDSSNKELKVMLGGANSKRKADLHTVSLVPKLTKIDEMIVPIDDLGQPYLIVPIRGKTLKDIYSQTVGKVLQLYLNMEFQNKRLNYMFIFNVEDFQY
jgi:hypothetical protein